MGRIVIETDPETGLDKVELTLDTGQVLKFQGNGRSELHFVRGEQEFIDVGGFVDQKMPGLRHPDHWEFSVEIDKIPSVESEGP